MMSFSHPWKRISTPRPRHLELSEFFSPCRSAKTVRLVSAPPSPPSGFGKIHERNTPLGCKQLQKKNMLHRGLMPIWSISSNYWKTKPFFQYKGIIQTIRNSPRPSPPWTFFWEISNNSDDPQTSTDFTVRPWLLGLVSLQGFFDHLQGLWVLDAGSARIVEKRVCWLKLQLGGMHRKQQGTIVVGM